MPDEFVAVTGYTRKYAIRLLTSKKPPVVSKIYRPRVPYYSSENQEIIKLTSRAANSITSLKDSLPSSKKSFRPLNRTAWATRNKLISISAATIDRILEPQRKK